MSLISIIRTPIRWSLEKTTFGRRLYEDYREWRRLRQKRKASLRLRRYGAEIFRKVQDILSPLNVPYFASYGTLLGLIRDNGFIPHDVDVDFGVMPGAKGRVAMLRALLEGGFEYRRAFVRDGRIVELSFQYKKVPVDFFFFEMNDTKTWDDAFSTGGFYPVENEKKPVLSTTRSFFPKLEGIRAIDIFGMNIPIPENAEEMLTAMYGSNWRVPIADWQENDKLPNREYLADITYVVGKSLALACCD